MDDNEQVEYFTAVKISVPGDRPLANVVREDIAVNIREAVIAVLKEYGYTPNFAVGWPQTKEIKNDLPN